MEGVELNIIPVTDGADERIADYASLKDRDLEARRAAFIAEGELVVRRLIGSRFRVRSVLLAEGWLPAMDDALRELPPGTPVYVASPALVNSIVGFPMHRGVLAAGDRGVPLAPANLFRSCSSLVILENFANHDNVGGIFRTSAALGGSTPGVMLSPGCCDPLYRKSIRVSMGWALRVPFARLERWPEGLATVAAAGFEVIAMTPAEGARDLEAIAQCGVHRPAILLGTEGPGLTEAALRAAPNRCRIAMSPGVDSLNVVVAGAVALSRLVRRA